ncbi:MAG: 7,8-didemethyl-8-hydroxy-5-deazariboflavin synthase CofG [Deltaproteobacteria bacterium]|nr:7,8-didemethyl-8-hydroxy-5-deazariboflavin synthase CofG [Deltaproteobacteria bacterium]
MARASAPLALAEAERVVTEAVDCGRLASAYAERLGNSLRVPGVLDTLLAGAFESKRRGHGDIVSVSRNLFIPLTNLCRDRCAYCTFAKQPDDPAAKTYGLDEVAEVVRDAVRMGCIEALFCLGDKPEIAYKSHRAWLAERGLATTAEHLVQACQVAFEGGMLPHTNAGILSAAEMTQLRQWNASLGLMLETTSARLRGKGEAHYYAPDKDPAVRIRMHEEAGALAIPFTSGILLGIGENVAERVDTLRTIRDIDDQFGHIQEVIVQPFHPKPGTPMRGVGPIGDDEIAGWTALARLILGPRMNVQAPPNLAPKVLERLLRSGLNDWGGVSPVTIDFINPEAPWPELAELRRRTEAAGQRLVERLPVYPRDLLERPDYFEPRVREAALRLADASGYARPPKAGARVEAA